MPLDVICHRNRHGKSFPQTKVCVVGNGFGGLYTALRLSTLVWPGNSAKITLATRGQFVFKPLLYELLTEELELDEGPAVVDVLSRSG